MIELAKAFVTGNMRAALKDITIERLDFDTFCACVTPGHAKAVAEKAFAATAYLAKNCVDQVVPELADTHGYGEAKVWATELVADISAYRAARLGWSEVSNGAVLHGPPGTGKSFFAGSVAKAAGLPLITI